MKQEINPIQVTIADVKDIVEAGANPRFEIEQVDGPGRYCVTVIVDTGIRYRLHRARGHVRFFSTIDGAVATMSPLGPVKYETGKTDG